MTLIVVTATVFVLTLVLLFVFYYLFIEAPASKRKMQTRLAMLEETALHEPASAEMDVVRKELLSDVPLVHRILVEIPIMAKLQVFLRQADLGIKVATVLLISGSLGLVTFLVGFLAGTPILILLPLTGGMAALPHIVIAVKRGRRLTRFEEAFAETIDLLARAVRAGHALTTGLQLVGEEMREPVGGEFRVVYEQQNLGLPLGEALHNLAVRVPLADVSVFVSALQLQRSAGGNVAEVLDNLAAVIRERFKIMRQIKVFTAQGRLTLYFLTSLAPLTAVGLFLLNPDYMMRLFTDPLGHKFVGGSMGLLVMGYLIIRKIIKIKV